MTLETVVDRHVLRQKRLGERTATHLAGLWRHVDRGRIASSWRELIPAALAAVATSQATAAAGAAVYVEDAIEAQGVTATAAGRLSSGAFAGRASDGRELASLLYQPAVASLVDIRQGATPARAMASGLVSLDKIVRTQIADAGRSAEAVAIAARPKVAGYVRMVSLPACARCLILAGRRYRWNAGFLRHPRCDCRHVPAAEDVAGDISTDAQAAFKIMPREEQDRVFGQAGAEAIRAGADPARVVNSRRGMATASAYGREVRVTYEAAGRRPRLMPEQIFIEAKGNRGEAIRLLRLHGYIR